MSALALCYGLVVIAGRPTDLDTLTSIREVSGVRIIQRINHRTDLVAVRLYLLGGTRQLSDSTAGIEALFLRAATLGTEHYPGRLSQRAMARAGVVETLEPNVDWTVTGFVTRHQDLDSAWLVFADRLTNPTLDSEAVRQAREQMLTAARRRYADPDERIRALADQVAFPDHPYAIDPEGTEESLGAITARDVTEYPRIQLVTSRMLLVVVGDADTAHVSGLVTRTIGAIKHGDYQWTLPPATRQEESHYRMVQRELPTNYVLGYMVGPPVSSPDYVPFRVATELLSSRLHETIRVGMGLSYAAYAPFLERAVGVGGLYASTPKPEAVVPIMLDQIRWLLQAKLDGYGLNRFVSSFRLEYFSRDDGNANQADHLARAELYLGDYRQADRFLQQLNRVSPDDVVRVTKRYMRAVEWAYIGNTDRMKGHW
jgi:zinc protease